MHRHEMTLRKSHLAAAVALALTAGCASMGMDSGPMASARLEPTKGNAVSGTVTFAQKGDKVLVAGTISGLKPGAEHGFHVHDKGDCSSGDGMSAGGHFNPAGKPHGHHGGGERHVGDMPNLQADAYGNASVSYTSELIKLGSGPADVIGRGLIVHRDPDDYRSQPVGNAGPRLACAVIRKN